MAVGEARVPVLSEQNPVHAHHESRPRAAQAESPGEAGRGAAVVTSLAAGACAGALAKTAIAPLDRAKINFQTSQRAYSLRAAARFLRETVSAEGAPALWRGNSATMARIVPYAAVQFTAHEQCKRALGVDSPAAARRHPYRHLAAGSAAGVISQSVTYPLDVARARMAVTSAAEYRSLRDVFRSVARDEGPRALYRGYAATILGVIPYAGVSFFTYDSLKHKYLEYFGKAQSGWLNVLFGGCAGALAQTASYPLEIVRRRMQTARRRADGTYACATIPRTVRYVYRTEGLLGFYKGLSMNWVKGPIAVGISFATYDATKSALRNLAVKLQS